MNYDNNDREYPVKTGDLRVGEHYFIEERRYADHPNNYDFLEEHGTITELKRNPYGAVIAVIRFDTGAVYDLVAENYYFYPRPRNWAGEYKKAAVNAAALASRKGVYRERAYGALGAKQLPLPNVLKQKVGSFLTGMNANLNTQKTAMKSAMANVKPPEPGMNGGAKKRRKTVRKNTRKHRRTLKRK
jgi:hypothetical protein